MSEPLTLALARALTRLADHGGQSRPTDAQLSVLEARTLVVRGLAEAIDAPKLILTATGVEALAQAAAILQAAPMAEAGAAL